MKQPTGSVDGIDLWKFIEGNVYDVGPSLGNFLLASRWAEPVADESPALVVPIEHPAAQRLAVPPKDTANDRSRRIRRNH